MTSLLQQQQRVLDDLTTSVQDLRVDVRKTQTSPQAATNVLSGSAPGAATAGARHNLDSGSVDSIEDLGRLLAENADLDRLVTKVREAQQQLHVDGTVRLLREEECSFRSSTASSAGRWNPFGARLRFGGRRLSCKALTLHPVGGVRIAWDALQLLLLCFSLFSLPLVLGFEDILSAAEVQGLRAANAAFDALLLVDVLLNFRVAVISPDGVLVRDARTIAHHYAQSALLRDLLGACPLSLAHAAGAAHIPSWLPLLFGAARAARTRRLRAGGARWRAGRRRGGGEPRGGGGGGAHDLRARPGERAGGAREAGTRAGVAGGVGGGRAA